MRLYTLVDQPFDEVKADLLTDGDSAVPQITQLEHDAMAAHALLQAINDTRDNPYLYGGTGGQPELVIEMIEKRAAEILAGWLREERG